MYGPDTNIANLRDLAKARNPGTLGPIDDAKLTFRKVDSYDVEGKPVGIKGPSLKSSLLVREIAKDHKDEDHALYLDFPGKTI